MTDALLLTAAPLNSPDAELLLSALVRELQVRYDDEGAAGAPLLPEAFSGHHGTFLVAYSDGRPVGCGGLRRHRDAVGELKRMYVDPAARGRGVGRRLLAGLEERGRELGYHRLLLETGTAQPEAVALYEAAGWLRVPPYGEWRDSPCSICFARDLAGAREPAGFARARGL